MTLEKATMKNLDRETLIPIVNEYYDHSPIVRFEFIEIVVGALMRCDDLRDTDSVIEDAFEYIALKADEWEILRQYCEYDNANWEKAEEYFIDDVLAIASRVVSECYEDEEEETDDEETDD